MLKLRNNKRIPYGKLPFTKALFHTGLIATAGLLLGIAAKLLDIHTSNLGNVFSQMSVWIFLCTLLAAYSNTPQRAAINVFFFCVGMLTTYYLTAELTASVYSTLFIYGWIVFALLSPIMGFCAWYAKGKGLFSKIITVCIIIVLFAAAAILFDKIRVSDMVFALLIGIVLLKKEKRKNSR